MLHDITPAIILLVEDDDDLRREMTDYLASQGYEVRQAADAATARTLIGQSRIDVAVLDVNLPGEDGLSLCRHLSVDEGPAILMLSALGDPIDRILGLELGADDYVVKPIPPRELLARVRALLRRRAARARGPRRAGYLFAGFRLDLSAHQLTAPGGTLLLLTRAELSILSRLLEGAPSVVAREALLCLVQGEAPSATGRGVDLHISRLRRKIQAQTDQEIIKTYHGIGYVVDTKVTPQ